MDKRIALFYAKFIEELYKKISNTKPTGNR